ncbi:hypothetical protein D3C73_704450 [compost metagenome]
MVSMDPWVYVVLLGLVIIVYARLLPKQGPGTTKQNVVQEIEQTIEHFAVEMDEQNRAILDLFSKTRQEYEVDLAKLSGRLETLEKQKNDLSQELVKRHVAPAVDQVNQESSPFVGLLTTESENAIRKPSEEVSNSQIQETQATIGAAVEEEQLVSSISLSMKSRYSELFNLYDQGKGVETIAKKLGMNKGEVNLIIQLSRQEEQARV